MGYRYIGSKARIVDSISGYIPKYDGKGFFVDAFCGMGHVAIAAAEQGWPVWINDQMLYAEYITTARLMNSSQIFDGSMERYQLLLEQLNSLKGIEGYFWREYSPSRANLEGIERRYFTEENAKKIDAIRKQIYELYRSHEITENEHILLLVDLMEVVNQVANIAGTYGCFLSKWSMQSQTPIKLQNHTFSDLDIEVKKTNTDVKNIKVNSEDVVYLDPPYTKRQYASYYHILETIAQEDFPVVEGVAGLRPWKSKASDYCYKTKALKTMVELVKSLEARRILISYSNDGHINISELVSELDGFCNIEIIELDTLNRYKSYIDLQEVSKIQEYLIIVEKK